MAKETPIINIFTYGLPYDLTNQIYNEFQDRMKEAHYIIDISDRYRSLRENKKTVELLLALSIFHKRVVSNLDAAVKFYGTVNRYSQADTITIGKYEFNGEEKNKILRLLINYRNLMEQFGLPETLWDYYLTKEFLLKLVNIKSDLDYADNQKKIKKTRKRKDEEGNEIPF